MRLLTPRSTAARQPPVFTSCAKHAGRPLKQKQTAHTSARPARSRNCWQSLSHRAKDAASMLLTSVRPATQPAPHGQPPRLQQVCRCGMSGGRASRHDCDTRIPFPPTLYNTCLPLILGPPQTILESTARPRSTEEPKTTQAKRLPLILGPPRTIWASSAATGASAPASTTAVQPAGLFWVRFMSTASRARRQSCRRRAEGSAEKGC